MDSVICLLDSVSVMMATQGKTAIQVSYIYYRIIHMVGKDVHLIVFIDYDGCFCFAVQLVYQGCMEQDAYKTVAVCQRMKHLHVILPMGPATVCLASLDSFAKTVSCIEYSKASNKRHRL